MAIPSPPSTYPGVQTYSQLVISWLSRTSRTPSRDPGPESDRLSVLAPLRRFDSQRVALGLIEVDVTRNIVVMMTGSGGGVRRDAIGRGLRKHSINHQYMCTKTGEQQTSELVRKRPRPGRRYRLRTRREVLALVSG